MRLLVIGASGLLGSNTAITARDRGWSVVGTFHANRPDLPVERSRFDLRDATRFDELIEEYEPSAVVNCAALTDVDECSESPDRARLLNATAPGTIAGVCAERGIPFAHVSTDYVFDGESTDRYDESATPAPRQVYGETKLDGERAVRESDGSTLIVRPSFIYGVHRATDELTGFPRWVRDRLRSGESVPLFTDQYVTPSRAGAVANALLKLLETDATGVYHVACRSCVTPYEFGDVIREALDVPVPDERLESASLDDVTRPAARPPNTCLDVSKLESTLDERRPTLRTALEAIDDAL